MGKHHITIHDIARELNVSASTVSRALQNHPRISKSTREAVQKLAAKYKFQPNILASSLRSGKSKTVGVIIPRINRNIFACIIGGMEEVLAAAGYHLIICQTHEKEENEIAAIHALMNAHVDGVMLSISLETINNTHIKMLSDHGIPLFFFDRVYEGIKAGSVVIDDNLGAQLNVRHLIQQGYRRIIHVAGPGHVNIYRHRQQGYMEAMSEAGIEVDPAWIMELPLVQEGGIRALKQGMEMPDKPDAFFCAGDFAALGVLQAALKMQIKIPEELGITGFANEPFTEFLEPPLTTVDQRGSEMGTHVAEMFLRCQASKSEQPECESVVLEPQLIIRKSSLLNR